MVEAAAGASSTSLSAGSFAMSRKPLHGSAPPAPGSSSSPPYCKVGCGGATGKQASNLLGTNREALAWLTRALLSVQAGLADPTAWRHHHLTWTAESNESFASTECCQSCLQECMQATWKPPHTADVPTSPCGLAVKFQITVAALGCGW